MLINEIFLSIQAESINTALIPSKFGTGVPTIFVRTHGCSCYCAYCDSAYTWSQSGEKGIKMTVAEIIKKVQKVGGPYKTTCITGGEVEIQPIAEVQQLIKGLKELGYTISVEATGTAGRDFFFGADSIVMDVKGPSAGKKAMERTKDNVLHVKTLNRYDQLKFLVQDRIDFDWMIEWLDKNMSNLDNTIRPQILVSPVFDKEGKNNAAQVVEWILKVGLDCTLNLQIHKTIWPVNKRGV